MLHSDVHATNGFWKEKKMGTDKMKIFIRRNMTCHGKCCLNPLIVGLFLTHRHCILVDCSTVICWMSLFVILEVMGLFCHFYSIFDGKSC